MLYEKILDYAKRGLVPMHMPGHKRSTGLLPGGLAYDIDISEIHGFDNLHAPSGVLKELSEKAAALYGAGHSQLLINGSTCGVLAAISACTRPGDRVLVARNCHKSVYNACELNRLKTVYINLGRDIGTQIAGSILPSEVEAALEEQPDIRLCVITSPTYEGVVSDIGAIAGILHGKGIPLFVDAAHGSHLRFFEPGYDAVSAGTDITVMSLHKTLPALTQCALLHVREGLVSNDAIRRKLSVFETSSPSYVLLSSIDLCLSFLENSGAVFEEYKKALADFYARAESLKRLGILRAPGGGGGVPFFGLDIGKIVICTHGTAMSGIALMDTLREKHGIELEMAAPYYAVAMTGVVDGAESLKRLSDALFEIDGGLTGRPAAEDERGKMPLPRKIAEPYEAASTEGSFIPLTEAAGRVCLEYIWAYPPGIPLVTPGELLGENVIGGIHELAEAGVNIMSDYGKLPGCVFCAGIDNFAKI